MVKLLTKLYCILPICRALEMGGKCRGQIFNSVGCRLGIITLSFSNKGVECRGESWVSGIFLPLMSGVGWKFLAMSGVGTTRMGPICPIMPIYPSFYYWLSYNMVYYTELTFFYSSYTLVMPQTIMAHELIINRNNIKCDLKKSLAHHFEYTC